MKLVVRKPRLYIERLRCRFGWCRRENIEFVPRSHISPFRDYRSRCCGRRWFRDLFGYWYRDHDAEMEDMIPTDTRPDPMHESDVIESIRYLDET